MVTQYPDTVTVAHSTTWSQETDGDFKAGTAATSFTSSCRFEPAGPNPVIRGEDGAEVYYTWVVYMPKTTTVFAHGDPVTVTLLNATTYTGKLKRQSNGQLNTRLWV